MGDFGAIDYNSGMNWFRNVVAYFLTILLFSSLFLAVTVTSTNLAFAKPSRIEHWIAQSGLYDSLVSTAIDQAQKSTTNSTAGGVSIKDPAVKQAAEHAFPASRIQNITNTFLDANYAWLQKKTPTPQFKIDLTDAKQQYANDIGTAVTAHLKSVPQCTPAQLLALQSTDPLTVTCRPNGLDPVVAGKDITTQLMSNDGFLANPVITASSLNAHGTNGGKAYYVKFAHAPDAYKLVLISPWGFLLLSILCILAIIFVSVKRRAGLRRVGTAFILTGIVLTLTKPASKTIVDELNKRAFDANGVGDIQKSLTTFVHLAQTYMTNINLYAGIIFVVIGVTIFVSLTVLKGDGTIKMPRADKLPPQTAEPTTQQTAPAAQSAQIANTPQRPAQPRPIMDIGRPQPKTTPRPGTAPLVAGKPAQPRPKKPRLIQ